MLGTPVPVGGWCWNCSWRGLFQVIAPEFSLHSTYGTKSQLGLRLVHRANGLLVFEIAHIAQKASSCSHIALWFRQPKSSGAWSLPQGEPAKGIDSRLGAGFEIRVNFHQDLCPKPPKTGVSEVNGLVFSVTITIWAVGRREDTLG